MTSEEQYEELPAEQKSISEIASGDKDGNDQQMLASTPMMAEEINSDHKESYHFGLSETLQYLWTNYISTGGKQLWKIFEAGIRRFTDIDVRKQQARDHGRAENKRADGDKAKSLAEAEESKAEAAKILAEADAIRAATEEVRARTKRRDELAKKILESDIKVFAEEREGVLRVLFMKEDQDTKFLTDDSDDN